VVKPPYRAMTGGFNDGPPSLTELLSPPDSSPADPSGRIYWRNWAADYDYVYLLGDGGPEASPAPGRLAQVAAGEDFRLYRVLRQP
jgi:hypothetical protein